MRLGIAQLCFVDPGDASYRVDQTEGAIRALVAAGADLILLPELAASGYVLDAGHLAQAAEPNDASGPVLSRWADLAASLGVAVVGGYCERDGTALYNSAIALGPVGEILGHYRKLHLFGAEHGLFEPGDLGIPVYDFGFGCGAMLICYDLRFPETVRLAALQGAQVVFVPTAWVGGFDRRPPGSTREIGQIEAAIAHADLNQVFICCADQAGRAGSVEFLGRSVVIDPYGEAVLGPLSITEPSCAVVEIDLSLAGQAQDRGPGISPRANRRPDVYGALLGYEPSDHREVPL